MAKDDAKEDGEEREEGGDKQKKKGLSMKLVAIIGAGTLLLALGGTIAYFKLGKHEPEAVPEAKPAEAGKIDAGQIYDLESFIVNLSDAPDVRYLKITVKLELERAEVQNDITARLPQVRDAILILLSSKDSASLRSAQGKFQLRDELTHRINNVLPRAGVRSVYFTEFVVQ